MDSTYQVMKHVTPGDDMNDDWVSVLDVSTSEWNTLRFALSRYYNELLRQKNRMMKAVRAGKKLRRRPSELVMEMADITMLYNKIAAVFPPPIKKAKS